MPILPRSLDCRCTFFYLNFLCFIGWSCGICPFGWVSSPCLGIFTSLLSIDGLCAFWTVFRQCAWRMALQCLFCLSSSLEQRYIQRHPLVDWLSMIIFCFGDFYSSCITKMTFFSLIYCQSLKYLNFSMFAASTKELSVWKCIVKESLFNFVTLYSFFQPLLPFGAKLKDLCVKLSHLMEWNIKVKDNFQVIG